MSSNNNSKVAIITGAGTGVGSSVAQRFLTEGYQVALLVDVKNYLMKQQQGLRMPSFYPVM